MDNLPLLSTFSETMTQAWRYVATHPTAFSEAVRTHVQMSALAVGAASLLAIPLGFLWTRRSIGPLGSLESGTPVSTGLSGVVISGLNAIRVIPGLAVLALIMPVLGTGLLPAAIALVLLAFPTVLLNTMAGFRTIDADVLGVARGLGMDRRDILLNVELPLAAPAILNGLRVASVEIVSGATLAAFIGGGGLGTFIVNGLSLYHPPLLLVGALPVAAMAMTIEGLLSGAARLATRHRTC
jgi:osmoprotectant transport system permease protein